jgi:uncharacterized membrane protein
MKRFGQFLLATLARGILFLLPFTVVAVLIRETHRALLSVTRPLAGWLPIRPVFGVLPEDVLAIVVVTSAFLIAGLFVATRSGRALSDRLERLVLYRVPGYLLVRGAVGGVPGLQLDSDLAPVLVRRDEGWSLALLVERLPQGLCTVFIPESPGLTSGEVLLVEAGSVRPLGASVLSLLSCLTRSGVGAGALAVAALGDAVDAALTPNAASQDDASPDAPSPALR